jgi:hypothetical protein
MEVGQGPNVGCSAKGKKKYPINSITNPNPRLSHCDTHDSIIKKCTTFEEQVNNKDAQSVERRYKQNVTVKC